MKKACYVMLVGVLAVSLSGCVTMTSRKETDGLRNQISDLEYQIRAKDQEIDILRDDLARVAQEKDELFNRASRATEIKSRPSVKDIQTALLNAGYDPGAIDGKKGKATKQAIKAFQAANGLPADGVAGKKTWELLKGHLGNKLK